MTRHYKNQLFGTLWAKHPATFEEISYYNRRAKPSRIAKDNRHKYWYCVCTACQRVYIVRADYLPRKKCQCQKNR